MLFCRRCYQYDCYIHRDKQALPDLASEPKTNNTTYRPCSKSCYKIDSTSQRKTKIEFKRSHSEMSDHVKSESSLNGFYSTRSKLHATKSEPVSPLNHIWPNGFILKPSLKRKLIDDASEWSSSDKSLFRVFYTIYGNNICMIANLLDKPCSQVYLFYTNDTETNKKNYLLQRQSSINSTSTIDSFSAVTSTSSSDSNDIHHNGVHHKKKKLNGNCKVASTNGTEESNEETSICNGKDRSNMVCEVLIIAHMIDSTELFKF